MTVQPMQPTQGLALPTVTGGSMPGLQVLGDWLGAARTAEELVRPLVNSVFVPDAFKPKIPANASPEAVREAVDVATANATAAVLLGMSLGVDPLTSLQQIYVVHGRPGMYAKFKVALVQARGHRIWDEELTPDMAVVCGQRAGTDDVVRVEITMDMAKRAGWTSNAAYAKTPQDMLWARAASRVVDRIAADVLMGIASVEDIDPVEVSVDKKPRRSLRQITRDTAPAASEERAAAAVVVVDPTPPDSPIDTKAWAAINARFVDLGVDGPGKSARRLTVVSGIVGREVTKGSELTRAEGELVITELTEYGRPLVDQLLEQASGAAQIEDQQPDDVGESDSDGDYDPTTDETWEQQ